VDEHWDFPLERSSTSWRRRAQYLAGQLFRNQYKTV
jgi:hypothetical protein